MKNDFTCIALYGKVNWDISDVYSFIEEMESAFSLLSIPATRYDYCEDPFRNYGSQNRGGSVRNVKKKIDSIYANGLKLKTLEFFALPKDYSFPYNDYSAYYARGVDYLIISYDPTQCIAPDYKLLIRKMNEHISAVWGECFRVKKGYQAIAHCIDEFSKNPTGKSTFNSKQCEDIQIMEQFTFPITLD